jgi:hypothetical protein
MTPTHGEVLRLLAEYASQPRPSGPVPLSDPYLKAVESWESLPENAERTDKGWVLRADRSWRQSIARARLIG